VRLPKRVGAMSRRTSDPSQWMPKEASHGTGRGVTGERRRKNAPASAGTGPTPRCQDKFVLDVTCTVVLGAHS